MDNQRPPTRSPARKGVVGTAVLADDEPPLALKAAMLGGIALMGFLLYDGWAPASRLADYQARKDCAQVSHSVWTRPSVSIGPAGLVEATEARWVESKFYCAGQAEIVKLVDSLNEPTLAALSKPAPADAQKDGIDWSRPKASAKKTARLSLQP